GWNSSTILAANASVVYVGGDSGILVSKDGGATWTSIASDIYGQGPRSRHIALATDSQGRLLDGSAGGLWRFDPVAFTWTDLNGNLAITTFNGIASHPTNPDILLGGSEDNGTELFTGGQAWSWVDGGDGGQVQIDPVNPNFAYHVENGVLQK